MAELSALEAFERFGALGPDFLTWMLVRHLENVPIDLDGAPLDLAIGGPLMLEGPSGEATKISLSGEEAASAPEVRSALREGKKLVRARLTITIGADQYVFTLDAGTFDLRAVKLPVPKVPDLDQHMEDRLASMQFLQAMVDRLYEGFLPIRLSPKAWAEEAQMWKRASGAE